MSELTAAELRYECSHRGLPERGAKDALEIRLEQHFTNMGIQANSVRFQPMETTGQPELDTDKSPAYNAGHTESSTDDRTPIPRPLDATHLTPTQTAQHAVDLAQAARGIIKEARQAAESAPHRHSLESRLTMFEECMSRFGEDQRRIAETMRRLELGMSRPTPEPRPEVSEPTRPQRTSSAEQHRNTPESPQADSAHQHTHTHATNTEYGARGPAVRDPPSADNHRTDRNVTFDNASYSTPHTTTHTHNYMTQSTLIPYDEVRTCVSGFLALAYLLPSVP